MKKERDYNLELKDVASHKYSYNFDFDVMHPFMLNSFVAFFRPGNCLELGSFRGDFTRRLLQYFDDLTCVEASDQAIESARAHVGNKVKFVNSRFETANLPQRGSACKADRRSPYPVGPALRSRMAGRSLLSRRPGHAGECVRSGMSGGRRSKGADAQKS